MTVPDTTAPGARADQAAGVATRRDNCRLCGSRDLEVVVKLPPTPIGDAYVPLEQIGEAQECYPMDLYQCLGCGHAQLLDVVSQEVLWSETDQLSSVSLGLVEHFEGLAKEVLEFAQLPGDSLVVDIGSNDGTYLKLFQQEGMRVLGVDPAPHAARQANSRGVQTLHDFFTPGLASQVRNQWGPAKLVTANRVFANIDDLSGLLEGVKTLLDPDGLFVIETGYLADILNDLLLDTVYHEHLGYHSVKPLAPFFARNGMELIHAVHQPIKGGSLRAFAQLAGGQRRVSESVAQMTQAEDAMDLHRPEAFSDFNARLEATKAKLATLLDRLKKEGRTVAGYGASVGATTLIYHLGLEDKLAFLVDDDPRKQDLFSPRLHLPVYASDALCRRSPDYVLIFAWRYAAPIIESNQPYLRQGGHFILPFPKVEIK